MNLNHKKEVMKGTVEIAPEYGYQFHKGNAALAWLNAYIFELDVKFGENPTEGQIKIIRELIQCKTDISGDLGHIYRLEHLVDIHEEKIKKTCKERDFWKDEYERLKEMNKF